MFILLKCCIYFLSYPHLKYTFVYPDLYILHSTPFGFRQSLEEIMKENILNNSRMKVDENYGLSEKGFKWEFNKRKWDFVFRGGFTEAASVFIRDSVNWEP